MDLLFGVSDMELLFAPRTTLRKRPLLTTSILKRNMEITMSTQPKKEEEMLEIEPVSTTSGYGICNAQNAENSIYQQKPMHQQQRLQESTYQQQLYKHGPILIEHQEFNTTEPEEDHNSIPVTSAPVDLETINPPPTSQIISSPIQISPILEETFTIPPTPVPPIISTACITILEGQNQLKPLEDSISDHFGQLYATFKPHRILVGVG
ncbi:hypothetical protein PGT21_032750 [Puccinia graminis f. sp. tritici]|uniref:Uncharacterized protein n=1 Tax=Puccinia graminis f. sp. tritici TaxID=56615 RepID=A0A5B0N865_PUCGR|nr:hypothetical protein PGT21_032750 [Puccinia graminis f. sp. tritici]